MKLSEAKIGRSYKIKDIKLSQEKTQRLVDLGLTKGTKVDVISIKNNGPMIIRVRGTRLAMGRIFCDGIIVGEMED